MIHGLHGVGYILQDTAVPSQFQGENGSAGSLLPRQVFRPFVLDKNLANLPADITTQQEQEQPCPVWTGDAVGLCVASC